MDIKFGFADTARELVISAAGDQAELTQKVNRPWRITPPWNWKMTRAASISCALTAWSTSRSALQRSTPWDSPAPKASA